MNPIFIHSGPVHSGKTTRLLHWAAGRQNIDGIAAPVIDNQRYLQHLRTNEVRLLEVHGIMDQSEVIEIGRYRFSSHVFSWAHDILIHCSHEPLDWLVIDEIGPLELDGQGLEPAVSSILNHTILHSSTKIVLVVRDNLYDKVLNHYGLNKNEVQPFILEMKLK